MTTERSWAGRVFIGASLDGFIARPDGAIEWLTDPAPEPEHATVSSSTEVIAWEGFLGSVDTVVFGRGTYEKALTFDSWPYDGKRVMVLSTTVSPDDPRIAVARDLADAMRQLAASGARQVYVDGGKVIQSFLRADLIDEITIGWAPVLIGEGLSLFGLLDHDVLLTLVATSANASGMVNVTYAVHRRAA